LAKLRRDDVLESVRIIRIGEEAQSFRFDEPAFTELYASARKSEIDALGETNPELPAVINDLGAGMEKTYTGMYYQVLSEGEGEKPKAGSQVSMNYVGRLLNGTVFDSSIQRGQTFDFVLGRDGVIPGWIEMVSDMTTGESRRVVVPPHLAYGEQGLGPIEPNSWLIFDMELVGFVDG
jgi:peptidylprolyl isomerase